MTTAPHPHSNARLGIALVIIALVIAAAISGAAYLVAWSIPQSSTIGTTPKVGVASACDVPLWNSNMSVNDSVFPFVLMPQNSTAYVCVTYQSPWQGNVGEYWNQYSGAKSYQFGLYIVDDSFYNTAIANGLVVSGPFSFRPSADSDNVTVVYQITSNSNSTGFYWGAIPWGDGCESFPLAVDYGASQVNASDFQSLAPVTCLAGFGFTPVSTSVGGMNETYISLGS